ncbi:hypothetical protein M413DRAFT_260675 [Hebeloma cylindrosporum]|uniref:Uncharacterized protein n=1 Tax=Hebeloma cylindrosporum TaxID=76867 RepID=A0A0C3CD31_HEBCY|nr:hypothetical protein M413DRAFT_260675 [Hebeloma cylindrosporum h7]
MLISAITLIDITGNPSCLDSPFHSFLDIMFRPPFCESRFIYHSFLTLPARSSISIHPPTASHPIQLFNSCTYTTPIHIRDHLHLSISFGSTLHPRSNRFWLSSTLIATYLYHIKFLSLFLFFRVCWIILKMVVQGSLHLLSPHISRSLSLSPWLFSRLFLFSFLLWHKNVHIHT